MNPSRLTKRFIRAGAFISKEISEIRRQPRLVLSLILGPFMILLLFGIGYQGETKKLTAQLLVPAGAGYSQDVKDYEKLTGGQLNIAGVTTDEKAALDRLALRQVDLVVSVPRDISKTISAGAQVKVPVYYNEVDPLRSDAITYLTYLYINEINKQTVAAAASQGQQNAGDIRSALVRTRNALAVVEKSVQNNQLDEANRQVRTMQTSSTNVQLAVILLSQFVSSDTAIIHPSQAQDPGQINLSQGTDASAKLTSDLQDLNSALNDPNSDKTRIRDRIGRVRTDIDTLDRLTQQFQSINPLVLAAPFYGVAENRAPTPASFTTFFGPGVLALLLQHIAVTIAALSMVRERLLGTVELFRVSPVSPAEIMAGKYASFLLILGVIAGFLLLMMSNNIQIGDIPLSLGVPILGNPVYLVLSILLVIFASVALGFLISTVSKSESQAVQLSMLVLLTSVFFSGFFLRLEALWPPIRALSYALPVTYGIQQFQTVMLRGSDPSLSLLAGLFILGLFFATVAYVLFNRDFRKR